MIGKGVAMWTAKMLDKASFHLRKWATIQSRGKCPKCGGVLTQMPNGIYRCESCRGE